MGIVTFVKGSDSLIEGLAIPFGGPLAGKDLDGEDFGADTDLALDWFPHGRPVIYHHGLDGAMKTYVQGRQVEHEVTDEGVWARGQLDKSAKYHSTVSRLIAGGKLFFSSGSMPHLVDVGDDGHIKRWPWVELSLTPTPSNPLAEVHAVKSSDIISHLGDAGIDVPAGLIAAALKALDDLPDDDGLPDGLKFAEHADRLLADVEAFRTRTRSVTDLRGKAGRVLSASTRERLTRHPASLRELADDLDGLLAEADSGKSLDFAALYLETERQLSRALGVDLTGVPQ